jgi:hypothetical protein
MWTSAPATSFSILTFWIFEHREFAATAYVATFGLLTTGTAAVRQATGSV